MGVRAQIEDLSTTGCSIRVPSLAPRSDRSVLEVDFGALGRHSYLLTGPTYGGTDGHALRIRGRIEALNEPAQNALAAALFVLAPAVEQLTTEHVQGARAATLARRLGQIALTEQPSRPRPVQELAAVAPTIRDRTTRTLSLVLAALERRDPGPLVTSGFARRHPARLGVLLTLTRLTLASASRGATRRERSLPSGHMRQLLSKAAAGESIDLSPTTATLPDTAHVATERWTTIVDARHPTISKVAI